VFELDEVAAPITSANFLAYVDAGFFDGTDGEGATIVHRVIPAS
jgi:cyclophilin family peptidyl-prolyl cis-trans isomerase